MGKKNNDNKKKADLSPALKLIESTIKTLNKAEKPEVKARLIALSNLCNRKKVDFAATLKVKSASIIESVRTELRTADLIKAEIMRIRAQGGNAYTAYNVAVKTNRGIKAATIGRFSGFAACQTESSLIDSICREFTTKQPEKTGLYFAIVKNSENLPYKTIRLDWNKGKKTYEAQKCALHVGRLQDVRRGLESKRGRASEVGG